ncbi:MAG: hypothetical protein KKG09_06765 [Verrucomicrobia bacterium]|nr:hypothetical protein [Verrucomicrobiota bacterium]MBU4247190.1 hypothetical protein [Verrucomicrobiota bacterium]MBU4291361.1 hypothetical protein [Verrucomicrobiota bacterium]MBU4497685.1 hypothetical protein [Verrucomicrobiota bacterium]MCG2680675.1 hypothetical protein [Kiritimatiellia bacterium]
MLIKLNSFKIGAIIFILSFILVQAQAETNGVVADNANKDSTERAIGNKGKFLANTKIITADTNFAGKIIQIKKIMKEIGRTAKDKEAGPKTIEEAALFLSHRINIACPPTKCFEHEGVFYFSGGTTAKPVNDFSSGLAIKKGETTIYQWEKADKPDEGKSK